MKYLFSLILLAFLIAPPPALALSSDWQKDDSLRIRLISGLDAVGQETLVPLALDVELAPDWHTYWRSPGEAGLPPQIDWKDSLSPTGNLEDATLLYPSPKRYTAFGLETIGYRDHVVFPIDAHVRTPGQALILNPTISLLVCSSICVPKNISLTLTIPEGTATASTEAELIKEFRDRIPSDAEKSGLVIQSLINHGQSLSVILTSRGMLQAPDLFVENTKDLSFTAPAVTMGADMHSAEINIKPTDPLPTGTVLAGLPLDRNNLHIRHILGPSAQPLNHLARSRPIRRIPIASDRAIVFGRCGSI